MAPRGNAAAIVLLLLVVTVGCLAAWKMTSDRPGKDFWHDTVGGGLDQAMAEDKGVLVMFTADWCGPCRRFKTAVLANHHVETALTNRFACVKVDLTERGGPNDAVARELGVRSIPALHVYDMDGVQRGVYGGPPEPEHFIMWLNQH